MSRFDGIELPYELWAIVFYPAAPELDAENPLDEAWMAIFLANLPVSLLPDLLGLSDCPKAFYLANHMVLGWLQWCILLRLIFRGVDDSRRFLHDFQWSWGRRNLWGNFKEWRVQAPMNKRVAVWRCLSISVAAFSVCLITNSLNFFLMAASVAFFNDALMNYSLILGGILVLLFLPLGYFLFSLSRGPLCMIVSEDSSLVTRALRRKMRSFCAVLTTRIW